ncbi:hypothetical protein [Pedobacter sp. SG918]|uniref:hypothetical protein n=1 Tax=Pedobacter sp. SG918 TaxID=2587136 RepID=UPI00146D6033|nr:hypothetical protein [Pedobacter sp. SG918]NMN37165.1 hypothetical protein [Pedobacter sp. SG918]
MKKTILIFVFAFTAKLVFAQNTFPAQGNVGIGTSTPQEKLDIKGNILISSAEIPLGLNTEVGGTTPLFNMSINFREANKNTAFTGAAFRIDTRTSELPLFQWLKRDAGTDVEHVIMNLNTNGNLGLGVVSPLEKLSVNGNIRAKEIKVEASNWPDYVFEEGYKVGKLEELESYIKENKHLPEIPSAKLIEKEGLVLGEMNKKLLKNLEELTLHVIELNKRMEKLEAENQKLKKNEN